MARLVRGLAGIHLLAATLPLLYLATLLGHTGASGFQAVPALYPTVEYDPEQIKLYLRRTWNRPKGKVLAVWGLLDDPESTEISAQTPSIIILQDLASIGVKLRICSPLAAAAQEFLPSALAFDDPLAAAEGANAILVAGAGQRYLQIDLMAAAEQMKGTLFLDLTRQFNSLAADQAGLQFLPYGLPLGPPWLDPDLLAYAEHLKSRTSTEASLLLLPVVSPSTVAGRARWYLHLNQLLFPRQLYIYQPAGASGTSVQYREWVQHYRSKTPWRRTRRYEPQERDFSKITNTGCLRSLLPNERQAIEELGIDWVTFFSVSTDFRLQDWETISAAEALKGRQ